MRLIYDKYGVTITEQELVGKLPAPYHKIKNMDKFIEMMKRRLIVERLTKALNRAWRENYDRTC